MREREGGGERERGRGREIRQRERARGGESKEEREREREREGGADLLSREEAGDNLSELSANYQPPADNTDNSPQGSLRVIKLIAQPCRAAPLHLPTLRRGGCVEDAIASVPATR